MQNLGLYDEEDDPEKEDEDENGEGEYDNSPAVDPMG